MAWGSYRPQVLSFYTMNIMETDTSRKKILVVEDDDHLRQVLVKKIEASGFETLQANDGVEGLLIALDHRPDLILLDIMMPHDGIEMLEKLRAHEPYGKKVSVIILTNLNPDDERIINAIDKHEPAFYLVKANSMPNEIVERIREALQKEDVPA